MPKSKKWLIVVVLATTLLVAGSIGGVALAQTGSDGSGKTLLARVAAILGIEQQQVEDAFSQAQREMQEEALDSYLQNLVDQGEITQEQADKYKTWWQTRPDMEPYRQQLEEWQQARPDMPLTGSFGGRGFGGRGFGGGMGWSGGSCFRGW
ncbi:MAG: hypothetical protein AB1603_07155 [Chloroflexota bacterium]